MATFHDFTVSTLEGTPRPLASYAGQVLLVTNVASRCGLTPQYAALEALHRELSPRGGSVLGFPCNDFAGQEPGTADEIRAFCSTSYDVTFPLFAKVKVLGDDRAPVYAFLTSADAAPKGAGDVTWNFEKFVVGKDGQVLARFAPNVTPDDPELRAVIERALAG